MQMTKGAAMRTPTARDGGEAPVVFVLMPFQKEFDDVYHLGIRVPCESVGARCGRVDHEIFVGNILDRIRDGIAFADVLIADMTGKNANVFYEVGYAHAIEKRVILLTQHSEDIPFDLKHHVHIIYDRGELSVLSETLTKYVRELLTHSVTPVLRTSVQDWLEEAGMVPPRQRGTATITARHLALKSTCFRYFDPVKAAALDERHGHRAYRFDVIVVAGEDILDRIDRVVYYLPGEWSRRGGSSRQEKGSAEWRHSNFMLSDVTFADVTVHAEVHFKDQSAIVQLFEFVTLSDSGPRL